MFAKVVVDLNYRGSEPTYDYIIPEAFRSFLARGMRVEVPFQSSHRMGIVIAILDQSDLATKPITDVLDPYPMIDEETFLIVDKMALNAYRSYAQIFYQAIPIELMKKRSRIVSILDRNRIPEDLLSHFNRNGIWRLKKEERTFYPRIKRLKDQKIVDVLDVLTPSVKAKSVRAYTYQENHNYQKAFEMIDVIDRVKHRPYVLRKDLLEMGLSVSRINTWMKHGVLNEMDVEVQWSENQFLRTNTPSKKQSIVFDDVLSKIASSHNQARTFLLKSHSISSRMDVYLEAIKSVLSQEKKVLFLIPEIMGIEEMATRIHSIFDRVAIYHSGLSKGVRYNEFMRVQKGEAKILLGTRSAIFVPIKDLGLILMDEEHDSAYRPSEGVYFDTVTLAEVRSNYHQIPLILGSATPSIETMYRAKQGQYTLLDLSDEASGSRPKMHIIDMKKELEIGNTSILSNTLKSKMDDALMRKEQVVLLYNRKGYSPYVLCRSCGFVPKCPHCDVSLTLYKEKNTLKCPYCGYEETYNKTCPSCQENRLREVGIGIEYVEQQIKAIFPETKVLRLDRDTTKTKHQHERIYHQFKRQDADILIGTQMVSKALDFKAVTLVGILLADASYQVPSYLAKEQAFMLFSQFTNRFGREQASDVVIQTYRPNHETILDLINGYDFFYQRILSERKLLGYPPFQEIAHLIFEGDSMLKTYQEAFRIKKMLLSLKMNVLGPADALIKKIKGKYRYALVIKSKKLLPKIIFDTLDTVDQTKVSVTYIPYLES